MSRANDECATRTIMGQKSGVTRRRLSEARTPGSDFALSAKRAFRSLRSLLRALSAEERKAETPAGIAPGGGLVGVFTLPHGKQGWVEKDRPIRTNRGRWSSNTANRKSESSRRKEKGPSWG